MSKKKLILKILFLAGLIFVFYGDDLNGVNLQASVLRKVKRVINTVTAAPEPAVLLDMQFYKQEHSLSCEAAALRMVLKYRSLDVSEKEIIEKLGFDKTEKEDGIWGDPQQAFVGNIDGKMMVDGYGVHYQPVARVAKLFRKAKGFENGAIENLVSEVLNKNPVIIWGYLGSGKPYFWKTKQGKEIKAIYAEHTKIVIGFSGAKENPTGFFLIDPIYGRVYETKDKFQKEWASLGRSGVVVY